jgi:RHS repeat-associated protein
LNFVSSRLSAALRYAPRYPSPPPKRPPSATGKLQSLTYPGQARVELAYDSATKRLSKIVVYPVNLNGSGTSDKPVTLISQIGYTAWNVPATWRWGDNRSYSRSWDSFARPKAYPLGDPDGTGTAQGSQRKLDYDDAGRISTYTHFNSGTPQPKLDQSFDYDGLNRLTQATSTATVRSYRYDDSGNRTQLSSGGNSYTHSVSKTSNRYDEVQVPASTGVVKRAPQYDEAGHLKASGSGGLPIAYTASYSDRGRMDSLTSATGKVSYRYNALEQRISKSGPERAVPGGAVHYVYDEQGHVLGEYDAKGNPLYEVVWLNDQPLAVIRQSRSNAGGSLKVTTDVDYIYADHLDTPRLIVRASGDHAIVWRWDIPEPFGNAPADDNPNKLGRYRFNLRLPGQVFDSESALHYNHHRDYDAYLGRYVQSDPIGLEGGINTYSYTENNPVSFTDPRGLVKWNGTFGGVAYIEGVGAAGFRFDLTSECKCGKIVRIQGYVSTVAAGLGMTLTGSGGNASFFDFNPCPQSDVANGFFNMAAATSSVIGGGSCSKIGMGGLRSSLPRCGGPVYGLDISAGVYFGAAVVTNVEVRECCEPK